MSQVIPLKIKQQLKNNLASNIANNIAKRNMHKNLHRSFSPSSFALGPKTLLPILFIFKYGKKGSSSAFLQNILNQFGSISNLFSSFNFSPDKIEKSLNALNIISQFTSSNNSAFLSKFSIALDALNKFNTIQTLTKNLSKNSNDKEFDNVTNDIVNFNKNNPETAFKVIDTFGELMGDNSKKNIQKAKGIINATNKFRDINSKINDPNKKANWDIGEIINIVKPLFPKEQAKSLDSIYSIIKMMDLLSLLNFDDLSDTNEGTSENSNDKELNSKKIIDLMASLSDKTRDLEKENVIDIEDYDEELDLYDKSFIEIEFEGNDSCFESEKNINMNNGNDKEFIEINMSEIDEIENENLERLDTKDENNVNVIEDDGEQNNKKDNGKEKATDETLVNEAIDKDSSKKIIEFSDSSNQTVTNEGSMFIEKKLSEENIVNIEEILNKEVPNQNSTTETIDKNND